MALAAAAERRAAAAAGAAGTDAVKTKRARQDVEILHRVTLAYLLWEGKAPKTGDWPSALFKGSPNHDDPYLAGNRFKDGKVVDPWGNAYRYELVGTKGFRITCLGSDGKPGGSGAAADIVSERK